MNLEYHRPTRAPAAADELPVVCVVDGDRATREMLESLVLAAGWRPRLSASAEEFLSGPDIATPGCLLVDLRLPGLSGLDLQSRVMDRTALPVVFMGVNVDLRATVQAMKAGALDFLLKPLDPHVLVEALATAIARSYATLRGLAQTKALQERYEALSRREREVLWLVASGRLNKQAGGDLGISEITVKAHRGRMMRKMQASSVAELVKMATRLQSEIPAEPPTWNERFSRATPQPLSAQLGSA
jgi:FixJ family two-component response regulator